MQKRDLEDGSRVFLERVMAEGPFDHLPPPVKQSMVQNAPAFLKQLENLMPIDFRVNDLRVTSNCRHYSWRIQSKMAPSSYRYHSMPVIG